MKKNLLLLSFLIFIFFIILSFLVHNGFFRNFDLNTTLWLQNIISRSYDLPFSIFTLFGGFEILTPILLLILIVLGRNIGFSILTILVFILLHIVELVGKTFIASPEPPVMFLRYAFSFLFPSAGVQPGFSYPSGHSARTVFVSLILLFFLSRIKFSRISKTTIFILILLFDVVMLVSRVYLGEHWTSDVVGGALLGAFLSILTSFFLLP